MDTRTTHTHAARIEKIDRGTRVGEMLQRLAASNLSLYYKTKAAHWTVVGPHFWEVHRLLDKLAKVFFEAVDPLAERTVQIGEVPPLRLADVIKLSDVKDRNGVALDNRPALEALNDDCDRLSELYREAAKVTDEAEDPGTNNLITDLLEDHDEVAWFLRQTLKKEGKGPHDL
jgi:starvation-inducible DNA-binding protein